MQDTAEEWRSIVGWEGLYDVSNLGRVRSLDRWNRAPHGTFRLYRGCLRRQQSINGYRVVSMRRPSGPAELRKVHQLVLEAFVGPCPDGMECRHFPDRDRTNNRLENLSWGTKLENGADRLEHGTTLPGEANGRARLKEEDIPLVRERLAAGWTRRRIAKEFGVTHGAITAIYAGRNWDHL